MAACPRNAIVKRPEDGIVLIDEDRCRGYRFCMEACPYKKIYFNHVTKVAQKCIFCFPRIEAQVSNACARQCPGRIRFVGYRDDPNAPIYKLVEKWKVAIPLHPDFGTEPNVFYVPPLAPPRFDENGEIDESKPRIPDEYLVSLFGPVVLETLEILKTEMAKTRAGGKSELMDLLIGYRWKDMFGGFDRDPATLDRKRA
jgi:ethylbenzene hydroxylase subunit beta/complex iron-sulfur molybdoenzyme family reductase subunit beta